MIIEHLVDCVAQYLLGIVEAKLDKAIMVSFFPLKNNFPFLVTLNELLIEQTFHDRDIILHHNPTYRQN